MDNVFITHSKHDTHILAYIKKLVQEARVNPIFYRYDVNNVTETADEQILRSITSSQALFVTLSQNLGSSPFTQNWVGMEVGIARALNKRVYVFEEVNQPVLFPIPYLTDYVLYDLTNPQFTNVISSVAKSYNLQSQRVGLVGGGAIGGAIFGMWGLIGGATIGALATKPQGPPYVRLLCYHLDCKLKFNAYVLTEQMYCPACRRVLRYQVQQLPNGQVRVIPSPQYGELVYEGYVWFNAQGQLQLYSVNNSLT